MSLLPNGSALSSAGQCGRMWREGEAVPRPYRLAYAVPRPYRLRYNGGRGTRKNVRIKISKKERAMIRPRRIGHATFETPDLDKAAAYYEKFMGLVVAERE